MKHTFLKREPVPLAGSWGGLCGGAFEEMGQELDSLQIPPLDPYTPWHGVAFLVDS